jgi:hypothetical protein
MGQTVTPWWDTLKIRAEVVRSAGSIDDVQMSLFQAAYGTAAERPPYAIPGYYGEITHPSPQFIDLMAKVIVRLGGGAAYTAAPALWRLDQAMGGGKSHGLIGLYHAAAAPQALLATDIGKAAFGQAEKMVGGAIAGELGQPQVVILACDNMTAGKGVPEHDGPAVSLQERFLWRLFGGDVALFKRYQPYYADKSKLADALIAVGRPVLILVDEIMDYVRQLSDTALHDLAVRDMAFLRALLDVVNDVPHVAMVVVMIASEKDSMDLDDEGLSRRGELDQLLNRNGKPATINDNTDFSAILRRRLFENRAPNEVMAATSRLFEQRMVEPWKSKVFDALGMPWAREWAASVDRCYPFHPQLIHYAEQEWSKLAGFQRVRSTMRIFAATVYALSERAQKGGWTPLLIGPGDIVLSEPNVREAVIGSGLIADVRAQANYRQLASTDIVGTDDESGSARLLDKAHCNTLFALANPRATERAATCLFLCSIVGPRGGGRQGATEQELKAAAFAPDSSFTYADADGIISEIKDAEGGGLASAEVNPGKGGQSPRLFMSTRQTLNMLVRAATSGINDEDRDSEVAGTAERLVSTGPFKTKLFVNADLTRSPREVLADSGIDDARTTRLVVLDPRQFSLLNGVDQDTRAAIRAALGLGPDKLTVKWASSAVFAVVNTQRRQNARKAAVNYLAWRRVSGMGEVQGDPELAEKAKDEMTDARRELERAVKQAFQHVIYLGMGQEAQGEPRVERTITLEQENQSSLDGTVVWKALVEADKAFEIGGFTAKVLVHNLRLDDYEKPLDEIRDSFWSAPRMSLLPQGDVDLQEAIFEAVKSGGLRLTGADGADRAVTQASEIAVGQPGLRLVKSAEGSGSGTDENGGREGDGPGPEPVVGGRGVSTSAEAEVFFSFMGISLSEEARRDALYSLLQQLATCVDENGASFAQVQLKIIVKAELAEKIAELVRALDGSPTIKQV